MSTMFPHRPDALSNRRTRTAKRRRRFAVTALLVVTMVLMVWGVRHIWTRPLGTADAAPNPAADALHFTVLILGTDDRPDEPGRADSMLLGFVDLKAGSVKLLSLPRDSYADIPGHGWDKLNAAYAYGKEELTRQTVQKLIGRPVDYTVAVSMNGFEQIVDALGGIDLYVDENMDYDDPYDDPPLHIHLKQGQQRLSGVDALHYVRFRHDAQSDWGRMKRQQNFLKALVQAAKRPANLARLPELLPLVAQNVRTNLSLSQVTGIALAARDKLGDQAVSGETLMGQDLWTPYGYYLALDFGAMRTTVHEMAGDELDADTVVRDQEDAAAYEANLPEAKSAVHASPGTGQVGGAGAAEANGADRTQAGETGTAPTDPASNGTSGDEAVTGTGSDGNAQGGNDAGGSGSDQLGPGGSGTDGSGSNSSDSGGTGSGAADNGSQDGQQPPDSPTGQETAL